MPPEWTYRLFAVAAVLLAGWAGYRYLTTRPPGQLVAVLDPSQDLRRQVVGLGEVTFSVQNRSNRPSRVVGMAEG